MKRTENSHYAHSTQHSNPQTPRGLYAAQGDDALALSEKGTHALTFLHTGSVSRTFARRRCQTRADSDRR